MADLISRAAAIEAIQDIEQMYEREEDMDCAEAVMSARWAVQDLKSVEVVPVEKLNAVSNIALELVSKYEDARCAVLWQESMKAASDMEQSLRDECHEYRHRIKLLAGMKGEVDGQEHDRATERNGDLQADV